ncbi:MAG: LysR family transcriptional regulator ArgP [Paracoccaceae bacterium]|nr:LysR family transcriptional regulator ArgP [Paracoccaceae bacterium]
MKYLSYKLLDALSAVVRNGSFAAAAEHLGVSQSAVSQRVKLLEERAGTPLVLRGRPCGATQAGALLCRHLDDVRLLEHDLLTDLPHVDVAVSERPVTVRLAVNSDSLASWFPEVVCRAGSELGLRLAIVRDDQEHTVEMLRSGEAMAAVTTEGARINGFRKTTLGTLDFLAVCAPQFYSEHFVVGVTSEALSRAPCLVFDSKDRLLHGWARALLGRQVQLPGHWLPDLHGQIRALTAGGGWGMMPKHLISGELDAGRLRELVQGRPFPVPLYWQYSTNSGRVLRDLAGIVRRTAHDMLQTTE